MKYTGSAEVRKLIYKGNFGLAEDEFFEAISYLESLRDTLHEVYSLANNVNDDDTAKVVASKAEYCQNNIDEALDLLSDLSIRNLTNTLADLKRIHTIEKEG